MSKLDEFIKKSFQPGTPQGRVSFGVAFFFLGLMFALLGFWKTILIAALTLVGVFIGSADTIGKATANLIDKVIPPKNRKVVYTAEDREKVRKATGQAKDAPASSTPKEQA